MKNSLLIKKIGLTGGIGSGKSLIAGIFLQIHNIPVFKADIVAKNLMQENQTLKQQVIQIIGPESYTKNGQLNKNYIASKIFNNQDILKKLNKAVHHEVRTYFLQWVDKQKAPYVLHEAAILIESGLFQAMDRVINVAAPLELRISRVMERDKMSREQILQRVKEQITDNERDQYAHFTIQNDNKHSITKQVKTIHQKIITNG